MTTNEILGTRTVDDVDYRVYLEQDQDCESPRDNDCNAGVIVTRLDSEYAWPQEDSDRVSAYDLANEMEERSFRAVARWLRMFHGATVVLPLYSGFDGRLTAGVATDAPGAGNYVGVTFDQLSTRQTTGLMSNDGGIEIALATDIDEYSTWARGDCWGYVIEKDSKPALEFARWLRSDRSVIGEDVDLDALYGQYSDGEDVEPVWEQHESCWGFIGDEYARGEALRALGDL